MKSLDKELQDPGCSICQMVVPAHLTVTPKQGVVKACEITTADGSHSAGKNGSNVSRIDLVVTVYWSGMIEENVLSVHVGLHVN